ncbi:hypothetical protein GCM10009827_013420 [Dactylosporangium maewongense]|uniref:Uncharacterized protein n=1 Tax=Dactylosporangium maewongense TaxID=634393 RepID=A0ABP4KKT2_9ACTN
MSAEHEPAAPDLPEIENGQPLWPGPAPASATTRSRWSGLVATPGRAAAVAVAATLVLAVVPCAALGAVAGAAIVGLHGEGGDRHGEHADHGDRRDRGEQADRDEGGERDDDGPVATASPSVPPAGASPTASPTP